MKSILAKIGILAAVAIISLIIGRCSKSNDQSLNWSYKIDSITSSIKANTVSRDVYEEMNDELSLKIKKLQSELDIRTKDLNSAAAIIASLRDSIKVKAEVIPVDPIIKDSIIVHCDSISITHSNEFDTIRVNGNTCHPEDFSIDYSINSNLSVFDHIVYKDAKTRIGRWWNRLWRIKPRTIYTIEPDNPNFKIQKIKVIKIND